MKKIFSCVVPVVLVALPLYAQPVTPVKLTPHTGFTNPIGIDHHQPTNKVVLSLNFPNGQPYNFELVDVLGTRQQFSNISGLTEEVKIATARDDGGGKSLGGFTPGELLTGTGVAGHIARISPDGSTIQNPWVVLPGEPGLLRGSLHIDRTGVFGGNLIVVTTEGNVWRVTSAGVPTKLASLGTHLEGVTTVPEDPAKYGPWAGKILAGAEQQGRIYTIDAQGNTAFFSLNIDPEDIDIIPANENFFGVDFGANTLWTAPPSEFVDKIGDVLIAQEDGGQLFHVRWTGTQFQVTEVAKVTQWEHVTFSTSPISKPLGCNVKIVSPVNDAVICDDNVDITATLDIFGGRPPYTVDCDINGTAATHFLGTLTATLPCSPGTNVFMVTCVVTDSDQKTTICRDKIWVVCQAPPSCNVEITAPMEGDFVCENSVNVTATVTASNGTVTDCDINGIPATVSGNTFTAKVPLTPGLNTLIATCNVKNDCGKETVCRATKRVFSALDQTPPSCTVNRGFKSVTGTIFDNESGIADIEATFLFNAALTLDSFMPGAKSVNYRLDDLGLASYMGFDLKITDLCGNTHICDPVLFQLEADRKDQPFEVTFRSLDRYLILTNHGLTKIRVNLNGNQFSLLSRPASAAQDLNAYQMPSDGNLTVDLQKYLRDGENHIRFEFDGPAGARADVMLIDEAHLIDHALELLPIPAEYQLSQNYPNPFSSEATSLAFGRGNPATTIRFSVPARAADGAAVQLRIYNMLGELVQTLVDERMFPGNYAITWNGRNLHGQTVAAGIYVYQLITDGFKQTKRMVILR